MGLNLFNINYLPEGDGGDEGIRTLDGLMTHTPLAGERLRPLGHVSERGSSDFALPLQVLIQRNTASALFQIY